jgi:hypothetical protein
MLAALLRMLSEEVRHMHMNSKSTQKAITSCVRRAMEKGARENVPASTHEMEPVMTQYQ